MKGLKTLTQILFLLFLGMIVGAIITGNNTLLIWSIVLLVIDVIAGIALQYMIDKKHKSDDLDDLIDLILKEELSSQPNHSDNNQSTVDNLCERFNAIHLRLELDEERTVHNIRDDEAGEFLLDVCKQMPYAPMPQTLSGLYLVLVEDLNAADAIVYLFHCDVNSICQNALIFLVRTAEQKIRLFAVETHFSEFVLCEYLDEQHINYGSVDLENITTEIEKILNE